jgi:hypothetical protein
LEKQINTERSVGTDNARYHDPSYTAKMGIPQHTREHNVGGIWGSFAGR